MPTTRDIYIRKGMLQDLLADEYKKGMTGFFNEVAGIGYKAILYAYQKRDFKNRTYNLHDSYGSAVFWKSQLVPNSIRFIDRERSRGVSDRWGKSGRQYVMDYFENFPYKMNRDLVIMCVAAMPYGRWLDRGEYAWWAKGSAERWRLDVIYPAASFLKDAAVEIKELTDKYFPLMGALAGTKGNWENTHHFYMPIN